MLPLGAFGSIWGEPPGSATLLEKKTRKKVPFFGKSVPFSTRGTKPPITLVIIVAVQKSNYGRTKS